MFISRRVQDSAIEIKGLTSGFSAIIAKHMTEGGYSYNFVYDDYTLPFNFYNRAFLPIFIYLREMSEGRV